MKEHKMTTIKRQNPNPSGFQRAQSAHDLEPRQPKESVLYLQIHLLRLVLNVLLHVLKANTLSIYTFNAIPNDHQETTEQVFPTQTQMFCNKCNFIMQV